MDIQKIHRHPKVEATNPTKVISHRRRNVQRRLRKQPERDDRQHDAKNELVVATVMGDEARDARMGTSLCSMSRVAANVSA